MERKFTTALVALVAVSALLAILVYAKLPDTPAIHWTLDGRADRNADKLFADALFPVIAALLALVFWLIPHVDPLKDNLRKFEQQYNRVAYSALVLILAAQVFFIAWNLGAIAPFHLIIAPAVALLFYATGDLCEHSLPSWFVGVRTPWTISDVENWKRANSLFGRIAKAAAVVALLGTVLGADLVVIAAVMVVMGAIVAVLYSLAEFLKGKRKSKRRTAKRG